MHSPDATSPSSAATDARPLVVFDDGKGTFGPLTDLRASFELRAGLGTLLERIERRLGRAASALFTSDRVAALVAERTGRAVNALPAGVGGASGQASGQNPSNNPVKHLSPDHECLAVNGRLLDADIIARSASLASGQAMVHASGALLAVALPFARLQSLAAASFAADAIPHSEPLSCDLAGAPWDITARIPITLAEDIAMSAGSAVRRHLRPDEGQSFGTHPILIDPSARIGPLCVLDASNGPIVIGTNVVVRPLSVLVGPCAVLDGSTVAERSLLKASTVIGPHCRAGGEIGGTIFQSYSNKSHDGHLGDSFVGEWVNIGAGSDNSNLLNTYGEVIVRLESHAGLQRTGRRFWGSIIGDHVKLAIGTRLMTGTTIGTGAMIAQSRPPSPLVARFAWLVDGADAARSFRLDKFMETARAMMSRRGQAPTPALEAVLRELHAASVPASPASGGA
jgi:UDP-N-acetylglucosamine diphosphorylase/glucosamine-1-phosphate N-acetyltransferase